jgi:hypothetical protein
MRCSGSLLRPSWGWDIHFSCSGKKSAILGRTLGYLEPNRNKLVPNRS